MEEFEDEESTEFEIIQELKESITESIEILKRDELEKVMDTITSLPKTRTVDAGYSPHTFVADKPGVANKDYTCVKCGLKGTRLHIFPLTLVVENYVDCPPNIVLANTLQPRGKVRIIRSHPDFGLVSGMELDIVQAPVEYAEKYGDKVWVISPKRNEPVRLLKDEYVCLND